MKFFSLILSIMAAVFCFADDSPLFSFKTDFDREVKRGSSDRDKANTVYADDLTVTEIAE